MTRTVLVPAALLAGCATAPSTTAPSTTAPSTTAPTTTAPARAVTGAVLRWQPGLNTAQPAARSTMTAAQAGQLLADVSAARRYPPGAYSCPSDVGIGVQVIIGRVGDPAAAQIRISLSGCPAIRYRGSDRMLDRAVSADLLPVAPAGPWRARLTT